MFAYGCTSFHLSDFRLSFSRAQIFGEILPQALCSRWGLPIGAFSAPFVRALLLLLYPLAKPIASLLDWLLGHSENSPYSKPQLKRFLSCGVNREGAQAGTFLDVGWRRSGVLGLIISAPLPRSQR